MNKLLSRWLINLLIVSSFVMLAGCNGSSGGSTQQDSQVPLPTTTDQPTVSPPSLAGRAYLGEEGKGMIIINDGGNGSVSSALPTYSFIYNYMTYPVTWNVDGNSLALVSSTKKTLLNISTDGNTLTDNQIVYTAAKSLSLKSLTGKHFQENMENEYDCSARSLSFTATELIVREECGETVNEFYLMLEEVPGVQNLLHAHGLFKTYNISVYIAMRDGDIAGKNKLLIMSESVQTSPPKYDDKKVRHEQFYYFGNGDPVRRMELGDFAAVDKPINPKPTYLVKARTECGLFDQLHINCPTDRIDFDNCIGESPLWLTSYALISCSTIESTTGSYTVNAYSRDPRPQKISTSVVP